MNAAALALAGGIFVLVSASAWLLAPKGTKGVAVAFVLAGLVASAIKIALFQQAPQWHDINPDSITYELNARAFVEHWQGNSVSAEEYNLRGLKAWHAAGLHGPAWEPEDPLLYVNHGVPRVAIRSLCRAMVLVERGVPGAGDHKQRALGSLFSSGGLWYCLGARCA